MQPLELPLEIAHRIALHLSSDPASLASVRLVNRTFSTAALPVLLAHPTLSSSTQLTRFLAAVTLSHSNAVPPCEALTLTSGTRTRSEKVVLGKGRSKRIERAEVEDAITPDQLALVLSRLGSITELNLIGLDFVSLRRRQLSFTGGLSGLRTLK